MAGAMSNEIYHLLQTFARAADKRALRPGDWQRFFKLAMMTHSHALPITGQILGPRLQSCGFPEATAKQLSAEFDRYCELLALYDFHRQQHPN